MKTLLIILILFPSIVFAGDFSTSLLYNFGSKQGKTTTESGRLSFNYDTDKIWIDNTTARSKAEGIKTENYLGAGLKHKITNKVDISGGLIWLHNDKDLYLASIRGRYKDGAKFTVFYQPYLNQDGFIVKTSMSLPMKKLSIKNTIEYRSIDEVILFLMGVEI